MLKRFVAWFRWHALSTPRTINEARILLATNHEFIGRLRCSAQRLDVEERVIEAYAELIIDSIMRQDLSITPTEYMMLYETTVQHLDEDTKNGHLTADMVLVATSSGDVHG